ncbi:MFS transporter [Pseudomonas asplenii]|uniref:MFS transporter n=1 Tax=Pseudomonas asplenii TaxID=53407 RepID=UPI00235FC389|nr:MFS transporter [Pseudomonas asplenii]
MSEDLSTLAVVRSEGHRNYWRLLPRIGLLYLAFGILFGLVQGGLPPLLRAQGLELGRMGWLFLLLLPFGMTFLWAPWVDRWRWPWCEHRVGWILAMQAVAIIAVVSIGLGQQWSAVALLALGLLVAFAAATMDLALDALVTETTPAHSRALAGAMKVGALSIGAMTGGGVFVMLFERLGWQAIFLAVAGLLALTTLPILGWRPAVGQRHAAEPSASLFRALAQPMMRRRLLLLSVVSSVLISLFSLNRVMLIDLGVPLETVGSVVGLLSPLCGLFAAVLAPWTLRRLGLRTSLAVFCVLGLLAVMLLLLGAWQGRQALAMLGAITINLGVSGLYVVICAVILGWANSRQAATDYAALYGISRLIALFVLMTLMQGLTRLGWPVFYGLGLLALPLAVSLLSRTLREQPDGN